MKFKLHDKAGNELTPKEFMARWKKGIQAVTPLQLSRISLGGVALILTGVVIGLFV
ncbi:unnamed protein product, partial [marine sediment metagenome]